MSTFQPNLTPGRFDRDHAEDSWTLPASWYREASVLEREREAIFHQTWQYQCAASDLPNAGDYYCGSVDNQDIFIVRDDNHELRAFYNVCSHRAHPLLEGEGNTRLIVCPYHQWCYQTNGAFRGARGKDALKDWIPDNAHLKAVLLEEYAGLLFVNLDAGATPLLEQAGKLLKDIRAACPGVETLHRVKRLERTVKANWKAIIDNNNECYHCAVNHPELMDLVDYRSRAVWSDDSITFSHAIEDDGTVNRAAYMLEGGKAEQSSFFSYIWPNTIPLFFPGPVNLVLFQIIPTGPEEATVRHDFYFPSTEPDVQQQALIDWIDTVLVREDMALCESVQRGLRSKGYSQGKFVVNRDDCSYSEHHVHFFQRMVLDAVMAER